MSKDIKGKKIYFLEICYDDANDEIEYVREYIDGTSKAIYYGDIDITDYFDEDGMSYIDELYELGES